jgi:prolyl oligopeptidase
MAPCTTLGCLTVAREIALPQFLRLPLPSRRAVLAAAAAGRGNLPAARGARTRHQAERAAAHRGPPVARIEPVTETFFGQAVTDPYRWMENPKDRDWEPFMKGQDAHARQVLGASPAGTC